MRRFAALVLSLGAFGGVACGQLLGLDDFEDQETGGDVSTGGTGGSTTATGGMGGSTTAAGGAAGSGTGGRIVVGTASCNKSLGDFDIISSDDVGGAGAQLEERFVTVNTDEGAFVVTSYFGDVPQGMGGAGGFASGLMIARIDREENRPIELSRFPGDLRVGAARVEADGLHVYGHRDSNVYDVVVATGQNQTIEDGPPEWKPLPVPSGCTATGWRIRSSHFSFDANGVHYALTCDDGATNGALYLSADLENAVATGHLADDALVVGGYFKLGEQHVIIIDGPDGFIRLGTESEVPQARKLAFQEGGTSVLMAMAEGPEPGQALAIALQSNNVLPAPFPAELVAGVFDEAELDDLLATPPPQFIVTDTVENAQEFSLLSHVSISPQGVVASGEGINEASVRFSYFTRDGQPLVTLFESYRAPQDHKVRRARSAILDDPGRILSAWTEEIPDGGGGSLWAIRGQRVNCL